MTHDNDTERSGIIRTLRELLEIVATESQRHEDKSSSYGPMEFGYEYSLSAGDLSEFEPRSIRSQNVRSPADRPIAVRYEEEGVLVTIDIPEIDPERVSASVSDDELLLGIDGVIEERIPLGKQLLTIDTSNLTNGILEFRLRPTEEQQ